MSREQNNRKPSRFSHFLLTLLRLLTFCLALAATPTAFAQGRTPPGTANVSGTVTLQGWQGTGEPTP